jgi:hypothetical protein
MVVRPDRSRQPIADRCHGGIDKGEGLVRISTRCYQCLEIVVGHRVYQDRALAYLARPIVGRDRAEVAQNERVAFQKYRIDHNYSQAVVV